ncbi:MAG: NUDIX domain-containing protein [Candidatus Paceibacterota bacterium]
MSRPLQEKLSHKPEGKTAVIAVIIRNGRILLGLRDYINGPTVWTAPGGSVDQDETLETAARREAEEETGITNLEFIDYVGQVKAAYCELLHIFHCSTDDKPRLAEPDKFREWIWYPLTDFAAGNLDNYINEPSREVIVDYLAKNDIL